MSSNYQSAVYFLNPHQFKGDTGSLTDNCRIYCGSEFCQYKLIHDSSAYEEIAKMKPISLVLPVVITRKYFKAIERIINRLSSMQKDFELVVNNFGILQWCSQKKNEFPITLGRILCYCHLSNCSKGKIKYKVFDKEKFRYLTKGFRVNRFEISVLPKPFRYILPTGFNISLYYPFVFVTMTRNCVFTADRGIFDKICCRECEDEHLVLDHPSSAEPFVMVDNGYLLDCKVNSIKDVSFAGINRYVLQKL